MTNLVYGHSYYVRTVFLHHFYVYYKVEPMCIFVYNLKDQMVYFVFQEIIDHKILIAKRIENSKLILSVDLF